MHAGYIVLILGILMTGIGIALMVFTFLKRSRCTEQISAEIIEVKKERHETHGKTRHTRYEYRPVVSYTVQERVYSDKVEFTTILPNKFKVGDSMDVRYNPHDPLEFYVPGKNGRIVWCILSAVLGILLLYVFFM